MHKNRIITNVRQNPTKSKVPRNSVYLCLIYTPSKMGSKVSDGPKIFILYSGHPKTSKSIQKLEDKFFYDSKTFFVRL